MKGVLLAGVLVVVLVLVPTHAQCINDCSNHGDCEAGQCTCEEGWGGEDCGIYNCTAHADGCSNHGQCRDSVCVCHANYGGYNCNGRTDNCKDFCKGHGSCLETVCTCDRGYKGDDCGTVDPSVSCPQNCSGHGFCDVSAVTPTCYCMPSYWTGDACDVEVSQCPPELDFCTGHGICGPTEPLKDSSPWVCQCEPGFCGEKCNVLCPSCPNNCTGHGLCTAGTCACFPGFGGSDCTQVVEIAECPSNCSGHGRCRENGENVFQCECDDGYTAPACTLAANLCPGNCNGHGECLPGGTCACAAGFSGVACDAAELTCAAHKNCSANGVCVDGVCKCNPGFSGDDCSQACHTGGLSDVGCNADRGHGVCVDGVCVCKEGEWSGVGCEQPAHDSTIGSLTDASNPLGLIVLSIVGASALLLLAGYVFNYAVRGRRGVGAVPGADLFRTATKGDDFEAAPENRYASNY